MDLNKAILYAQLVNAAYAVDPNNTANSAGQIITAGIPAATYEVLTTIYANDLSTDVNLDLPTARVSIGLVLQATASGDVVVAVRGTVGIMEWIHDTQFLLVPCSFMPSAGNTEDGFTDMYRSLRTGLDSASPTVTQALTTLPFKRPVTSVTICGHSLGGALASLLALDVAVNTPTFYPSSYTYASPRTGDPQFVRTYNHAVPDTTRIANRLDAVPNLPFPPLYDHVTGEFSLNPIKTTLFPPKIEPLLKTELACLHILTSYLHLLSQLIPGAPNLPLKPECTP
jgi:hypothetical protein